MSRRSQTDMAVLGVLSIGPMSGYAIRRAISEALGRFWAESYGQIYPTLARLVEDGLAAPDAPGRTSGTSFRITADGRRRLRALLRQPVPSAPARNGRLLRLFFGSLLGPGECITVVEEARASAEAALAGLARDRAEVEQETDPGAAYRLLTISAGEHAARAQLAWAEESLVTLRRLADAGGGASRNRARSARSGGGNAEGARGFGHPHVIGEQSLDVVPDEIGGRHVDGIE